MLRRHLLWALVMGVLALWACEAVGQEPATRPATRAADDAQDAGATEVERIFLDASALAQSLGEEEQEALRAAVQAGQGNVGAARRVVDAFAPLIERIGEVDLEAGVTQADVALAELPDFMRGFNPLTAAVLVGLAPGVADDRAALAEAADGARNLAALLASATRGRSTSTLFAAQNLDILLHQAVANRARSLPPELLLAFTESPPLAPFHEVTGREGEALAEVLRASETLPDFIRLILARHEIDAETVEQWAQEWDDADRRETLIREYDLYFAVEVELERLSDDPVEMTRFLEEWEAGHERESLWLSRHTLISPREGYAQQFRQRATRDLFAVVAAAAQGGDLAGALQVAGPVTGGGTIDVRQAGQERVVLIAQVPLSEEPALLPVGP